LESLLKSWGYETHSTLTGLNGVREAQRWHPHIVIADIQLPGALDGAAVARILRRDSDTANARFIGMSGVPEIVNQSAGESAFDTFVTKPIDTEWLRALLRELTPSRSFVIWMRKPNGAGQD
jgi:CheY-like chemotaxis protein